MSRIFQKSSSVSLLLLIPAPLLAGSSTLPFAPPPILVTPAAPKLTLPIPASTPSIPAPNGPKVALMINAGPEFDDQVNQTFRALQSRGYNIRLLSYRGETHSSFHTTDLMTRMLRAANPGDTVVFSFHAHGIKEDARNPYLGTREVRWEEHSIDLKDRPFTTPELKNLVDRNKKPGVKVVILAWSCSGGSTVLAFENDPEVCAISGTNHTGPGGTGDPAAATVANTKNFTFLDAAKEAENWFLSTPGASDRIHQRQYTSGCSEKSQHFRHTIAAANVAFGDWELQGSPFNAWVYPDRKALNEREIREVYTLALQRILQLSVEYYDHYRPFLTSRVSAPDYRQAHKRLARRILNRYQTLKLSTRFLTGLTEPQNLLWNLDRVIEEAARRYQDLEWLHRELERVAPTSNGKSSSSSGTEVYLETLRSSIREARTQLLQFNTEVNPLLNLFEEIDCSTRNTACSSIAI